MQTILECLEFKGPLVNACDILSFKEIWNLETLIHVAVLLVDNVKQYGTKSTKYFNSFFIFLSA